MIGHDHVLTALTQRLPRASLFVGPASVGKWTAAEHIRHRHHFNSQDVIRVRALNMETAREVSNLARLHAAEAYRLFIIRLDGGSPDAMNVLLKTLEETAPSNRFILIASEFPAETITSRCEVYRFGLLTVEQVEMILTQRHFGPVEAKRLAGASGGQVRNALMLADNVDAKTTVLAALRCIAERDTDGLDSLAGKWTDEHTALMAKLCREAISRRWALFSEAEVEGLGRKLPLRILTVLRPDIRPRLVVRASLMSVLRGVA